MTINGVQVTSFDVLAFLILAAILVIAIQYGITYFSTHIKEIPGHIEWADDTSTKETVAGDSRKYTTRVIEEWTDAE